jgi:hypothetical protein
MMIAAPKRKTTRFPMRRVRKTEEASVNDREFWTEIVRGAGIILKAVAKRYLGKNLRISS